MSAGRGLLRRRTATTVTRRDGDLPSAAETFDRNDVTRHGRRRDPAAVLVCLSVRKPPELDCIRFNEGECVRRDAPCRSRNVPPIIVDHSRHHATQLEGHTVLLSLDLLGGMIVDGWAQVAGVCVVR